jgi:hypothetical protein
LTWRASDNDIYLTRSDLRILSNLRCLKVRNVCTDRGRLWKVELMRRAMNRIKLHGCDNVEPCLLESQAQPARACKDVNRCGPKSVICHSSPSPAYARLLANSETARSF